MRKLSFNMLMGILYRVAMILTGLTVQRYILAYFGSDTNGITSSVSQILSYLVLLEAGIGAATVSSLHKPLAEKDNETLSALLSSSGRMYRRAGLYFLCILALVSALLPLLTFEEIEPLTVAALTALTGAGNVISYLFVGKYTPLLTADGKTGILYAIDTVSVILSCSARLYLMSVGASIVAVQAVLPVCAALRAVAITVYVKTRYSSVNYRATPSDSLKTKRRSAMTHQIVGLAVNHTDITLLTLLSTLKNVSLYSVYHYVYSGLGTLFEGAFSQPMIGYLGKKAADGSESFKKVFVKFEAAYNAVLYLTLSVALTLTIPFITVYTAGVTDMEYAYPMLAVLFCVGSFLNLIRLPSIVAVNIYGYFKETERSAIIECAVNLGLSLILFPFLGIYGLLLGTVAAYVFRSTDSVRFIYKKCGLSYTDLIKSNIGNIFAAACVIVIFTLLLPVNAVSIGEWVLKAITVTAVSAVIFAAFNLPLHMDKLRRG